MKCYLHPEKDAIGVCVMCGRGVCDTCSVSLGGKIYCKQCVEKIITKPTRETPIRATSITIASILLYIFGVLGIIRSLFVFAAGSLVSSFGVIPYIGSLFTLIASILIFLGLAFLIFSILEVVAGYWLWHSLKKGGILGLIVCILDILLSILFVPSSALITIISIILTILIMIFIIIGWNTLK